MVSFTPQPPYHQEIAQNTHLKLGWVGLRGSLETVKRRKISSPFQESNPVVQRL
jgi:hypothetical protein